MIDNEKIDLAMRLHEIEEMRVAGHFCDSEAQEHRMVAVFGFFSTDKEGHKMPNFGELRRAIIEGEVPAELQNITYDEDGENGEVCTCEACRERRGW